MSSMILSPEQAALERLKSLVLDGLHSPESKRAYSRALDDFLRWYQRQSRGGFTKATVNAYRAELEARGLSPSTINIRLSAIRKLAMEAADNGLMPRDLAEGITRVKGVARDGPR